MKTICFFNSTKAWGGGEKWHLEASSFLHERGYPVVVMAHRQSELYQRLPRAKLKCVAISIGNLSFLNPLKVRAISKELTKHNVGTVVMNGSRDLKAGGLAAKKAGVERIIYRRGSAIPIKNSILNHYYFKHVVDEVLANSEATKNTVTANNSSLFPKHKIKVIYNGIEIDKILKGPAEPLYERKNPEKFVIVTLGRLELQKNHFFLIGLASELKRRKLEFEILIGGDGSLMEELNKAIKEEGLEHNIKLVGFIHKARNFILSGDIFVLPSLWEGFGYVMAEAGLSKKPVIAFDCSSMPEVIDDGKTGFLVPVNDIKAFADKVQYLLENPKKRSVMGENGFEFVRQKFDSKIIHEQVLNYLVHG